MAKQLFSEVYDRGDCFVQFDIRRGVYVARHRETLYEVPGFSKVTNVKDTDSYGLRIAPLADVLALTGTEEVL
jgi:hypothetical protein